MNSLYDLSNAYTSAMNKLDIDEETGEILNLGELDAITGEFEDKAESVACYIKNLMAFSEAAKKEADAITKRSKAAEKKATGLMNYLTACMDAVGRDKVETARAKISFRKSTQVNIIDSEAIPALLMVTSVSTKPDKVAIKAAIQSGKAVAGAELVENRNIQIR